MNNPTREPGASFGLIDLVQAIWVGRWIVILVSITGVVIGISYSYMATEWFRAEVALLPADTKSSVGAGALSQFGGLVSLAGINLGTNGGTQLPLAMLRSKALIKDFIVAEGIEADLLAKLGPNKSYDVDDATDYFDRKLRTVTEDKKTGLITLAIEWTAARESALWANRFVALANERMREKSLEDSGRNLKFLQQELAAATNPALQKSITTVIESEMQRVLLARGNVEFAFKVIDRAVQPKKRSSPKRIPLVLASAVMAFVFGILIIVGRVSWGLLKESAALRKKE